MIIELSNGNKIDVFPCVEIHYDVGRGATWFNDPDQQDEYDFSYNYEGNDLYGILEEMEVRGCKNIECICEIRNLRNKIDAQLYFKDGLLSIDADDETYIYKTLAKELTDGLDLDIAEITNKLMILNMPLDELINMCWENSVAVFDLINEGV